MLRIFQTEDFSFFFEKMSFFFDHFNLQGDPSPQFGLGVTTYTLCPTAHSTYTLGTYAIGVYGNTPASFRIDLEYADEVLDYY